MARTGTNRVRDPSTRTARAIRRTAIRLFALASAGWVLLVPVVMVQFHFPLAITAAATAASVGILLSTVGYFLLGLLNQVQLLDHERHGLREAYDRARLDALRDGLTGLGNHRAFQEELNEQITVAKERSRPFALLFLDIDDLKTTNDARGHAAGDRLLKATATIITSNLRRWDRGFRIGGDEFAVVLLDCDAQAAVTTARRMLASALDGGAGANAVDPFSLTIGVSAYPVTRDRPPAARPPGRRRAVLGQAPRADRHPAVRPAATRHGRGRAVARGARRRGLAGRRRAAADARLPARL